jgi:hypothetical protein
MADFNLSQNNVAGECNLKCSYSFQYSNSSCVATNTRDKIRLSYDESNVPPVTYNGNKYKVSNVSISAGSNFLFNGKKSAGLVKIEHTPIVAGPQMNVIIPFVSGNSFMPSSNILTKIIIDAAKQVPENGNKSTIIVDNYNLNNIVPKKPFYSFSQGDRTDYIAFGIEQSITIDADTITKLNNIIKPISVTLSATDVGELFYNSKGPASNATSDDIYIDCQPVNVSEETIQMSTENKLSESYKLNSNYDAKSTFIKIYNNQWFQLFLLILAVVLFYYLIQYLLKLGDAKVLKTSK